MRFLHLLVVGAAVGLAASVADCSACSVPVFRYALEQWPPDSYRLYLFHRGDLSDAENALVARLRSPSEGINDAVANVQLTPVDLAQDPEPGLLAIWNSLQPDSDAIAEPRLVLQTPSRHGPGLTIWSGELSQPNVDRLLDSPARQEIARRILQGDSVVWVLLESGNAEEDDRAYETLATEIDRLQQTLKLPQVTAEDAAAMSIDADELKLAFSAMRVSRNDPAERLLAEMLLHVEPDLQDPEFADKPMVFPVFGRGRALYSLVGDGISPGMIEEAALFLTGDCQCTVKAQNPGFDLLISVDWDRLVTPILEQDSELPPLAGLSGFVDDDEQEVAIVDPPAGTATDNEASDNEASTAASVEEAAPTERAAPASLTAKTGERDNAPSKTGFSVGLIALAILLGIGVVVGMVSIVLVRREA